MNKGYFHVIAGALTLFICVSVQASTSYTYTTLDVPGAISTYAYGIDGGNIVGHYSGGSGIHGFKYDGLNYTTLDVDIAGAHSTRARDIDGTNIVGYYKDGSYHGFQATVVPLPSAAWMALPFLVGLGITQSLKHKRLTA